jgi:hypothetical protein
MNTWIQHLLRYFLFGATMFFAAGAPAIGDAGGTAGGDGSGSATGDGASGDGAPTSDDGGTNDGVSDVDGSQSDNGTVTDDAADGEQKADLNAPIDIGDGRKVPPKWKNLFDAAKAQGLDKEVKQLFFGQQRLIQKFPGGVNEAVKLADTLQEFGGVEGVSTIQQDNQAFHEDAQTFLNDPAKWLENSFAANEGASLKAFGMSLDFVADKHPEMYQHLMSKVLINTLDGDESPIGDVYRGLVNLKDNPQAQELAKHLADWYNGIKRIASKIPEKKIDPDRKKLEDDRANLTTQTEKLRNDTVNQITIPQLGKSMTTHIEKQAKLAGFDLKNFAEEQPGSYKAMRREILSRVMNTAAADAKFVKNYKDVMKTGDTNRAAQMMNRKHDSILADSTIIADVAKDYGITKKSATKPNAQRQPGNGNNATPQAGVLRVAAKPDPKTIDWSDKRTDMFESRAVLKNGKVVTWG